MQSKLIDKIKKWKDAVIAYDRAAINASKVTAQLSEARDCGDMWKLDDLKKEYEKCISELEEKDQIAEKLHREAILITSDEVDDKTKRGIIIQMLVSHAEFAGLDEKAIAAVDSDQPAMETVAYVHQIYIEHSKMIADKILEVLKI